MGVPVVLHVKKGVVCLTAGGKTVRLKWKPGQSRASLTREATQAATANLTGWEKDIIAAVVKAAIAAFLAWWKNRGPGSPRRSSGAKRSSSTGSGRSSKPDTGWKRTDDGRYVARLGGFDAQVKRAASGWTWYLWDPATRELHKRGKAKTLKAGKAAAKRASR